MNSDESSQFGDVIRAESKTVRFFEGLEVDGYRMPNGSFRVGFAGASTALGFASNWLGRAIERSGNTLKVLQGLGFTQEIQKVVVNTEDGDRRADTVTLRDFNRLIAYGVMCRKKAALALHVALTELSLIDFFRDAFGEPPLSIAEKRKIFYEAYASTISPEMWRQMDVEDILQLALAGDELYFPTYKDWEHIPRWGRRRRPKALQVVSPSLEL